MLDTLEYFVKALQTAELTQEDWDYCEKHYFSDKYYLKNKITVIQEKLVIIKEVNRGKSVAAVARQQGVSYDSARNTVMKGIGLINNRIRTLPEYKLNRILTGSYDQ